MITMILGGLWHGAAWPFVFWGIYQGTLLVIYRWVGELPSARRWVGSLERPASRAVGWAMMFHLTCYGWLLFRARSASRDRVDDRRAADRLDAHLARSTALRPAAALLRGPHLSRFTRGKPGATTSMP